MLAPIQPLGIISGLRLSVDIANYFGSYYLLSWQNASCADLPRFLMHVQQVFSTKRQEEGTAEGDENDGEDTKELRKVLLQYSPQHLRISPQNPSKTQTSENVC